MDTTPIPFGPTSVPARSDPTMAKARELEAVFLAEMLAHARVGESEGAFSGGAGEAQFASFLRHEQARLMVEAGGIGLAETIFKAMTAQGQVDGT